MKALRYIELMGPLIPEDHKKRPCPPPYLQIRENVEKRPPPPYCSPLPGGTEMEKFGTVLELSPSNCSQWLPLESGNEEKTYISFVIKKSH